VTYRYAAKTAVGADRSKAEIERLLERYGADRFMSGWGEGQAFLGFRCEGRMVKFVLPLPDQDDDEFRLTPTGRERRSGQSKAYEQEIRRRWRALALVIKAKLEAVETGITTFESEFLAYIVLPDGQTVGDHVRPAIEQAYSSNRAVRLLPAFNDSAEE
jgi:hypothetical protein